MFDESGQWRPGLRVDQLQVPDGVRLVLSRRLDRLSEESRRVLAMAAVIGQTFSLQLLEALLTQQPDQALEAIDEAERAHLIIAEPAGRDTRYRFVHELVGQTLSETLSLPRQRRLHAAVAEATERLYTGNLESHASALAHHLYQAGADPEKTKTYLVMAARQARAGAAHEEALLHLDHALSLSADEGLEAAELAEQRAAALHSIGRGEEAVEAYRKAIELFENAGELARAGMVGLTLAHDQHWRIDIAEGHRTVDHALKVLGTAEPELQITLLSMRGLMMSTAGEERVFAEVRARKAAGGQVDNAFDEILEIICLHHSLQLPRMLPMARKRAEAQRLAGDWWGVADAEQCLTMETCCGRPAEAKSRIPGAMALAEKIGHHGAAYGLKVSALS